MESRNTYFTKENMKPMKIFYEDTNEDEYTAQVIAPIVMQGDPIGTVILVTKEEGATIGEIEIKLAETGAAFWQNKWKVKLSLPNLVGYINFCCII